MASTRAEGQQSNFEPAVREFRASPGASETQLELWKLVETTHDQIIWTSASHHLPRQLLNADNPGIPGPRSEWQGVDASIPGSDSVGDMPRRCSHVCLSPLPEADGAAHRRAFHGTGRLPRQPTAAVRGPGHS